MPAHIKRNLVVKGLGSLNCWINKPAYAIGGPGNKGSKLPAMPTIQKIIPRVIQSHSMFKVYGLFVYSLSFEVSDLQTHHVMLNQGLNVERSPSASLSADRQAQDKLARDFQSELQLHVA